jgi:hypothetical protein
MIASNGFPQKVGHAEFDRLEGRTVFEVRSKRAAEGAAI